MKFEIEKSDEEWRKELDPETYRVAREGGTERAFTGKYWDHKGDGVYYCASCDLPLFDSEAKYDSGSGWPSFFAVYDPDHVVEQRDSSHGMERTELLCSRCGAHLGHIFPDGPPPSGVRYCINSAALRFERRDRSTHGASPRM